MEHKNLPGTMIPQVPPELFRTKPNDSIYLQEKSDKRLKKIIDETKGDKGHEITEEGFLTWHVSFPYPEKGVRDNGMMLSIQFVKRMLINWITFLASKQLILAYIGFIFTPWKWKLKLLEKFLQIITSYAYMVDGYGRHFILERQYYTLGGNELIKFISSFLKELGVTPVMADESAVMFIALIDNDTAYY